MKREQFRITSTAGHDVIKFKWNSAIHETERIIKEIARKENAVYDLTAKDTMKAGFAHVAGSREWTRADGQVVTFTIVKLLND